MDYKAFPFELLEAKAGGDGPQFSGYVSVFSNIDAGGDAVLPGAFDRTLKERDFRPLLWSHDQRLPPIGVEVSLAPDDKGLLGTWKLLDTPLGRDVYTGLKAGAIRCMSIGYVAINAEFDDMGVRKLMDVELLESSVVNLGMNEEALITGVKAVWSASYVNSLPDSAFAVILPGGEKDSEGKTTPRSLRKLPHHNADGAVDMPHLRNALSREPQTDMSDALHARAKAHLERHMNAKSGELFDADVPFAELLVQLSGWMTYSADEAKALIDRRGQDERKLSDAHLDAMRATQAAAEAYAQRMAALIDDAQRPPEAVQRKQEQAARLARLQRLGVL